MRELDTETPVVWPAWCYQSGKAALKLPSERKLEELSHEKLSIIDFFNRLFVRLLLVRLLTLIPVSSASQDVEENEHRIHLSTKMFIK